MGLDVAVVEAIVADPSKPLEEQAGTIVAVQSQPDFAVFEARVWRVYPRGNAPESVSGLPSFPPQSRGG